MKPILEIRDVSKQYKLGGRRIHKTETLRELVSRGASAPFRALSGKKNEPTIKDQLYTFWALKDVSLNINEGDVVGIIGRNGAGKSTLLKILSRITSPDHGFVTIRGRLASLLEVGTGFHPELTGRENIFLNGAILGMRRAEIIRRFDEIVEFAEVEKFLDTPVKHYSSGMYVRLAFAVAAHLDPDVLHQGQLCFDGGSKEAIQYYLNSLSVQSGVGSIVDLDGVGDRRSLVAPLLRRLEFLTENEQPLTEGLPIGARLKVKVHFDLPSPTANFNVGLGFNNSYGHRIFTAHSVFEPNRWDRERMGRQVMSCEIPSFTLMPGEYSVKVWLDLKGSEADAIEDAAKMTVLESDFYGTGRVPWNGALVMKHRWYLEQAADAK